MARIESEIGKPPGSLIKRIGDRFPLPAEFPVLERPLYHVLNRLIHLVPARVKRPCGLLHESLRA